MDAQVRVIETADERAKLQAFRMDVLTGEAVLDGYQLRSRQAMFDRYAPFSSTFALLEGEEMVGCLTCTRLAAVPDPAELTYRFRLEPALETFGTGAIMITDGLLLASRQRGEGAIPPLLERAFAEALGHRVRLVYSDCSPHLLAFYEQIGFRRYGDTYGNDTFGYKVPVVLLPGDRGYLERARSPLAGLLSEAGTDDEARDWFAATYPDAVAPLTAGFLGAEAFWDALGERIARDPQHHANLWRGMAPDQIRRVLETATILPIHAGDFLIRKGEQEDTVYVLLNGIAEVTIDPSYSRPLSILGAGDTIGEIGFLRDAPRSADVVARTDCEVLVLSGAFLESLLDDDPRIAARLMQNLARELAARLTLTSQRLQDGEQRI